MKVNWNLVVDVVVALVGVYVLMNGIWMKSTGKTSSLSYVTETISIVRKTDPRIMVLQGAGISTPDDVRRVILAGAEATGCTSGIIKNSDPEAMAEEMLSELRRSWDEAHN